MKYSEGLVLVAAVCTVFGPVPTVAFLEGFAQSIGTMNGQLTKFMEGLHQSVDTWADQVVDNANKEECFFLCPRGQDALPREGFNITPTGCSTFGIQIKDEDLPSKNMKLCCNQQQECYHRCNSSKLTCDKDFRDCLHKQCVIITKGKEPKHLTICDTATKLLLMGILSFGCKTYKDAQKEACVCPPPAANEL